MRIATEQRGDVWLAQVTHIGPDLHWTEHRRMQAAMYNWVMQNKLACDIDGWQFYFENEKDLAFFLLKWGS